MPAVNQTLGIPEAEFRVGRCYLEGAGVPPSRSDGVRRHVAPEFHLIPRVGVAGLSSTSSRKAATAAVENT